VGASLFRPEPRREPAFFLGATYLSVIDTLLASILGLCSCSGFNLAEWKRAPDFANCQASHFGSIPLPKNDIDTYSHCQRQNTEGAAWGHFLFWLQERAAGRFALIAVSESKQDKHNQQTKSQAKKGDCAQSAPEGKSNRMFVRSNSAALLLHLTCSASYLRS
jgi:hypothetical protein